MKNKLSAIIIASALAVSLAACGNGASSSTPAASSIPQSEQAAESTAASVETNAFDQFKAALDNAGYTYETTVVAADMVGAERGERYTFDFGSVELYRFADGAEALSTGEIMLEGFGAFPIEVNGNYGLVVSLDENADAITSIFAAL